VFRLAVLAVAPLLVVVLGCGGGGDEVELGAETNTSRAEQQRLRITELERELNEDRGGQRRATKRSRSGREGRKLLDTSDAASFERLASGLGGQVGLTVGRVGDPASQQLGSVTTGKAWSTIKLAIAARVLSDAGGPDGLNAGDGDLIRRAITASDNGAAAKLFAEMKARYGGLSGAAEAAAKPLREVGDRSTVVSTQGRAGFSPYGQTDWSLREQHRFMARLAARCVPDASSARYLLGLMRQIVSGQRWGIGATGVPSLFKGGWGPDPDGRYIVRQMGVLELDSGRHPVVLTIAALPSDGHFVTGQGMLAGLARWAVDHVDRAKAVPLDC
jgi:hypothetical protein